MNKYFNKIVVLDGIRFHSQKEADKYSELKLDPMVESFTTQPKFIIIDAFEKDGKKYRASNYIADFDVKYKDGTREIIDIKPYSRKKQEYFLTPLFKLKARLFDTKYPNLTLIIE